MLRDGWDWGRGQQLRTPDDPQHDYKVVEGEIAPAVWLSFDVDCLDTAFVPGTGWLEPGGFLPREVLKFIQLIAARPLAGIEVVECSPPYDNAEITALIATRVIWNTRACLVRAATSPSRVEFPIQVRSAVISPTCRFGSEWLNLAPIPAQLERLFGPPGGERAALTGAWCVGPACDSNSQSYLSEELRHRNLHGPRLERPGRASKATWVTFRQYVHFVKGL